VYSPSAADFQDLFHHFPLIKPSLQILKTQNAKCNFF